MIRDEPKNLLRNPHTRIVWCGLKMVISATNAQLHFEHNKKEPRKGALF